MIAAIVWQALARDSSVPKCDVFFYLDAHWEDDLPLLEEIEVIFSHRDRATIMIDDFCVPGTDYGFDDYGAGKTLNLAYLRAVTSRWPVHASSRRQRRRKKLEHGGGPSYSAESRKLPGGLEKVDALQRHPPS